MWSGKKVAGRARQRAEWPTSGRGRMREDIWSLQECKGIQDGTYHDKPLAG